MYQTNSKKKFSKAYIKNNHFLIVSLNTGIWHYCLSMLKECFCHSNQKKRNLSPPWRVFKCHFNLLKWPFYSTPCLSKHAQVDIIFSKLKSHKLIIPFPVKTLLEHAHSSCKYTKFSPLWRSKL